MDPLLVILAKPEDDQKKVAQALGYGDDVDAMNQHHDWLHTQVAKITGLPSHALRMAAGEKLTEREIALACAEEVAILAMQRYLRVANFQLVVSYDTE